MFTPDDLIRASDSVGPPRLLVSVQSAAEVDAAIQGGAQIVDIKDPARGSLGCAGPEVIGSIRSASVPVTAALGECRDWSETLPFAVPGHLMMVKLGLAGLGQSSHWPADWLRLRHEFDNASGRKLNWVAVAYVDEQLADSPPVDAVATLALETDCVGLLLDTFSKQSGRLFDHITEKALVELAERLHRGGRFLAAAGRLRLVDVERLARLPVDIVAVRSAACAGDDRRSTVVADNVAACRAALVRYSNQL